MANESIKEDAKAKEKREADEQVVRLRRYIFGGLKIMGIIKEEEIDN